LRNWHQSNEQGSQVDKLAVEGTPLGTMHIEHQQRLEDKSLGLQGMFDTLWGIVCGTYHRDIYQKQDRMFRELGKEQLYLRYIHHLGIEASLGDSSVQLRICQGPNRKFHPRISQTFLGN
jgi:hypothetical protein